jgi:predicted transcriptional regulator
MSDDTSPNMIELATELTIAWLGNHNNRVAADDVPAFLQRMHDTVAALGGGGAEAPTTEQSETFTPAVSVRKSLASPDHIISMIDGKPYKTLRRHLSSNGLTPEEYRARYGLKADYPMVAESYSEARRSMAKTIGLGRKPRHSEAAEDAVQPEPAPTADTSDAATKPVRKGRAKKADA